ncbi:hypothetical protein ACFC3F_04435 [Microbacterium sp. NPDC055910]|uniref:hypothetical protein n=1 Tax=Microbacterium sp. NPDC055910 TaxID=3345659 RepID=UPI0035D790D1
MSDRQHLGNVPMGAPYAPPYVLPRAVAMPPPPPQPRAATTGIVALVAALVASVVAPLVVALAAYGIGSAGIDFVRLVSGPNLDWAALSPVRDIVLLAEVAGWAGTTAGIWALVQGIIAIATGAGRGQGIAAVVLAVGGPVIFAVAAVGALALGLAAAPY